MIWRVGGIFLIEKLWPWEKGVCESYDQVINLVWPKNTQNDVDHDSKVCYDAEAQ